MHGILQQRSCGLVRPVDSSSCVTEYKSIAHDHLRPRTTAGKEGGGASLRRHPPQQRDEHPTQASVERKTSGEAPHPPSRGATSAGIAGKRAQFHAQASWAENENLRPSTTTAVHDIKVVRDHGSGLGDSGAGGTGVGGGVGVEVCVRVGGVGIGAAAKARLYRGYCAQRGGDYDREYRRHGGREALERIALLNDSF